MTRVSAIGERKGIKGKEMEEEKFFLYRKRGYRSRNRCKAGNWPRKAVTIESWERTIFPPPPAITFRIRPPCIKYDVVVQFKQAWRGIRRRIGTFHGFTAVRIVTDVAGRVLLGLFQLRDDRETPPFESEEGKHM